MIGATNAPDQPGAFWRSAKARERAAVLASGGFPGLSLAKQPELGQGGHAVIKPDFLDDFAVLELKDGGAGGVHLPAGVGRQAANEEVVEGRAGVGAAAFPLADDVVAFGDQVRGTPEVEVG